VTRQPYIPPAAPHVTLYTREGCHLCEVADHQLRALQMSVPFHLHQVDITSDPDLERRFLIEIPVVAVNDEVITSAPIDVALVRRAVLDAGQGG
jgi:hypothetical protein